MNSVFVFVDTFHWIAEINARDEWHGRCVAVRSGLRGRSLITSEEVLSEVLDFFSGFGSVMRSAAVMTVTAIVNDANIQVVEQSHESFLAAIDYYRDRTDKRYSLTDCSSMALMKIRGIRDVLTHDHHFTQEGFRALLD
jgi:predicted nucleic acid-binding protein